MADFFNRIKKSIDKGTAIVGAKSSTLIETNKLKQDISTTNRVKKDTLMALGEKVYELNRAGTFTVEAIQEFITKISEAEAKVVDLEAKIVLIQDEEKSKLESINAEAAAPTAATEAAPIDVVATEVADTVVAEAADAVAAVEPVTPVAPVAPVAAEAIEAVGEAVEEKANETGEYNG